MTNTITTRLRKRVTSKPIFHTTATKLEAVNKVNTLIRDGLSQTKALARIAKPLKVTSQTVQNWREKYELVTMSSNRINGDKATPLVRPVGTDHAYHGRFGVQSINLMTTDGVNIRLTVDDLKEIAKLAGSFC